MGVWMSGWKFDKEGKCDYNVWELFLGYNRKL